MAYQRVLVSRPVEFQPIFNHLVALKPSLDAEEVQLQIKHEISSWLNPKFPNLKENPFESPTYNYTPRSSDSVRWVTEETSGAWALRIIVDDTPPPWAKEQTPVPGRHWTTDLVLFPKKESEEEEPTWHLHTKVDCSTRRQPQPQPEPPLSRPTFINELARNDLFFDGGEPITPEVEVLTEARIQPVVDLLNSAERRFPVVLFSPLSEARRRSYKLSEENGIYRRSAFRGFVEHCCDRVHFFELPPELWPAWEKAIGGAYGIEDGELRLFYPSAEPHQAELINHHYLARSIAFFDHPAGPNAFFSALRKRISRFYAERRFLAAELAGYSFDTLQAVHSEQRQKQLSEAEDAGGMVAEYEKENQRLRKQIEELSLETDNQETQRRALEEDNSKLKGVIFQLKQKVKSLQNSDGRPKRPEMPADYNKFAATIEKHYPGLIKFSGKAERGLQKSVYENKARVWEALCILAEHYPEVKAGEDGAHEAYTNALKENGLEDTAVPRESTLGQYKSQYTFQVGRKNYLPTRELKHGTSYDPRYCLRIYFTWSDDDECVLVGPLTEHLDNTY